jgi:hypothetical protein
MHRRTQTMSTRAVVEFGYSVGKGEAYIYNHWDGFPKGIGADLERFLDDVEMRCTDTRFNDPMYLATKWVVWCAEAQARDEAPADPLMILGVGVTTGFAAHSDTEWEYSVVCATAGRPVVKCRARGYGWDTVAYWDNHA